ncbi:MAG: amidohydrolase family protein, partial [Chitinophagaceae bacterium]
IDISGFKPTHKSSLKSSLPYYNYPQTLILVHNTFTDESDILFAKKTGKKLFWCLCPNANIYIENRMPPVELLLKQDVKIILGTDSLASNHRLSILEEIKTLRKYFPHVKLETMLIWATKNGAEALHCANKYGSFEKGKTPGILHLTPFRKNEAGEIILLEAVELKRIK